MNPPTDITLQTLPKLESYGSFKGARILFDEEDNPKKGRHIKKNSPTSEKGSKIGPQMVKRTSVFACLPPPPFGRLWVH